MNQVKDKIPPPVFHSTEELAKKSLNIAGMSGISILPNPDIENMFKDMDQDDRIAYKMYCTEMLEESVKRNQKRLEHAVQYLEKRKMLGAAPGIKGLIEYTDQLYQGGNSLPMEAVSLAGSMSCFIPEAPFSRKALYGAIELTAWLKSPDVFYDNTRYYGHVIKEHYPVFCAFLVLCQIVDMAAHPIRMQSLVKEQSDEIDNRMKNLDEMDKLVEEMIKLTEKTVEEKDRLQEMLEALQQSDLAQEIVKQQAQIQELKDRLERKDALIDKKDEIIRNLQKELRQAKEVSIEATVSESPEKPQMSVLLVEEQLPPVPEENVLFLGGHKNLAKKIKERHPKWQIFDDSNLTELPSKNLDGCVVILYTGQMSHKLWKLYLTRRTENTIQVFAEGTNLDYLENTIRRSLAETVGEKRAEKC